MLTFVLHPSHSVSDTDCGRARCRCLALHVAVSFSGLNNSVSPHKVTLFPYYCEHVRRGLLWAAAAMTLGVATGLCHCQANR